MHLILYNALQLKQKLKTALATIKGYSYVRSTRKKTLKNELNEYYEELQSNRFLTTITPNSTETIENVYDDNNNNNNTRYVFPAVKMKDGQC